VTNTLPAKHRQLSQFTDLSSPLPTETSLRRLRRRSSTPTRDPVLSRSPFVKSSPNKKQKSKQPSEKSEFVEDEANESDDDEVRGFGLGLGSQREEELEEEGADLDRHDERLVNDEYIDNETLAEHKVMEKVRFVKLRFQS
jgi:mediator of replication checkpoint protein 1